MMLNIIKAKRQLVELILTPKVLPTNTRAQILETFIEPVLLYSLSTFVYGKVDDNRFRAVSNTAQRIVYVNSRVISPLKMEVG